MCASGLPLAMLTQARELLAEIKGHEVKEHGRFRATDFDAPLVL